MKVAVSMSAVGLLAEGLAEGLVMLALAAAVVLVLTVVQLVVAVMLTDEAMLEVCTTTS
jgi:hypothetical protein